MKPPCIWFTGLPASGKTTLGKALVTELVKNGRPAHLLDGDDMRQGLCAGLGFSPEDRRENIRRVAEAAKILQNAGIAPVVALISPYAEHRRMARNIVFPTTCFEVYVDCPARVCEERDPKGLWAKARADEIPEFTGVSAPYEPPKNHDVVAHTAIHDVDYLVGVLLMRLETFCESLATPF